MATIIAGGFDVFSKTQAAIERLREAGIAEDNLCEFRVNPAGEHDQTPIGGDRNESPGAKHADRGAGKGVAIGAAIGTAAGLAATPLLGPAGIVAGAGVGEDEIVRIFEECGAQQVERAEGTWGDGEWQDFDPVSRPHLAGGKEFHEHHAR